MDVKSPAAADQLSRPSPAPYVPAEPSRMGVALRRAGIAVIGVGVAALTGVACVLSFEDLRVLALAGQAPAGLAYLYPAGFDALLVIAMISVLLLRGGGWPVRLQAGVILTLLFAGAAAAEVATAMRMAVDAQRAAVVVSVAPWVFLILALWLWLLLIKHAAARRAAVDAALTGRGHDLVPFPEADLPTAEYPVRTARDERRDDPARADRDERRDAPDPADRPARTDHPHRPAHAPHPVPPGQLVHHPAAEIMLDPLAAPPLDAAPHHDLPPAVPVVGPTAAPETPEVTDLPPDPPPARADRPMRWGDLVRPHPGDLLVHPRRPAPEAAAEKAGTGSRVSERVETWDTASGSPTEPAPEVNDRDADTQPFPVVTGRPAGTATDRPASRTDAGAVARTGGGARKEAAGEAGAETARASAEGTGADAGSGEGFTAAESPESPESVAWGAGTADASESPDPVHEAGTADPGEEAGARAYEDDTAAPPSGRVRSTPVPPGE
ncbi:hypothetical protein GCM10010517_72060 [Streptosporangium fragile]|uniref:DUF2637 domain-containing protein n=1 Tax=Streptosporangium fragile TaxID=46186 RepID=A0ABP6IQZ3_9ACTN